MPGSALHLGLVIGPRKVVAVPQGRRAATHSEAPIGEGALAEALPAALATLVERVEASVGRSSKGAQLRVALLPPLADARVIALPPLGRKEARAVLERDVGRHFLGGGEPQVVGFQLPGRRAADAEGARVPVFVAVALRSTLETVRSALARVGWKLVSLEAAHGIWRTAATDGEDAVVAIEGDAAHLIRLEDGAVTSVRRLPADDPGTVAEALGPGPGRVLLLSDVRRRGPLTAAVEGAGWQIDPEGDSTAPDTEAATAARAGEGPLELVPATLAAERVARSRRMAGWLVAAAVVLLMAAAGAVLWGTGRELAAVRAERAAIREQVAPLLAARDSLDRLQERLTTLERLRAETIRWVPALVEISALLPLDTHLTGLFASGDTLELEAAGAQAGQAIQALREAGILQDVRLDGIVERELEEGETITERFRVRGRLAGGGGSEDDR